MPFRMSGYAGGRGSYTFNRFVGKDNLTARHTGGRTVVPAESSSY